MKTINKQIQKTGVELLTVMTILLITFYTISAQGSFYDTNSFYNNELTLSENIMDEVTYSSTTGSEASMAKFSEYMEIDTETEMKIENWMTETENFNILTIEKTLEEDLDLENWMFNDSLFALANKELKAETITKAEPKIKNQAVAITIPGSKFGRRTFILYEMDDNPLEFESWMFDKRIWNTKNLSSDKK